jgi:hypothetical protein
MTRLRALLLILLCGLAGPVRAQPAARGQAGLRARMAEFLRSLPEDGPTDTTRRFFPTTGDWSYTHTVHEAGGGTRIQRWIFPAAQTSLLFGFDKDVAVDPVRESFQADPHGQTYGLLISIVEGSWRRRWRRVGRNRFVPPGAPASSPVFVEWRREPGRWVIAAFGDERYCSPRRLGYERGEVAPVRRFPAPAQPAYAANEGWYLDGGLSFDGQRYARYGQPRTLQPGELEQMGWKDEVRVYVEKGQAHLPLVLYVPVAPDIYQPYLAYGRGRDPYCPR